MLLMNFPWSKNQQRQELLGQPFPDNWLEYIRANVAYYQYLSRENQQKLRDIARIIIAEKSWEGCGGLTLTDEMQVTIAAQAALLVLGFDHEYYPNVETILVYPQGFLIPQIRREECRVLKEQMFPAAGLAAQQGPVIIAWSEAQQGGKNANDGSNVVLHEFAHKLDMRDGSADGTPYLRDRAEIDEWSRVMSAEYQLLVEQSAAGHKTLIDPYGATNPAEFFAVTTECFFEKPHQMQQAQGELYAVLRDYYHQDPATLLPLHNGQ